MDASILSAKALLRDLPSTSDMTQKSIHDHLTWMRLRGLSADSITQRRRSLGRLASALPVPLLEADERQLYAWQSTLRGAPAYLANQVANAACYYRWAHEDAELIATNPARRLVRPKVPKNLPRPIDVDKLEHAVATAAPDVRAWLTLAAFAGVRAGEMSRLLRADVLDQADEPALVLRGKGAKMRVVPMSSRVLAALHEYGMPTRGSVFRRRDGQAGPPSPARISQLTNQHLHDLGYADTGHAGRHLFATRLYKVSRDIRLVQYVLGHDDIATTTIYTRFELGEAARWVEVLAS